MNRRGFTLIGLMAALALLAVFMLASARLFTSMMRQVRDTTAAREAATGFDAAVARLRADVWSAERLQGDGPTLVLTRGNRVVTWAAGPGGGLVRTEVGGEAGTGRTRRWDGLPVRVSFSIEGNVVGVRVTEKNEPADVIAMASEAVAIRGGAE